MGPSDTIPQAAVAGMCLWEVHCSHSSSGQLKCCYSLSTPRLLEKSSKVRLDPCVSGSKGHRSIFKAETMLQFSTFATASLLPSLVSALWLFPPYKSATTASSFSMSIPSLGGDRQPFSGPFAHRWCSDVWGVSKEFGPGTSHNSGSVRAGEDPRETKSTGVQSALKAKQNPSDRYYKDNQNEEVTKSYGSRTET